MKKLFLLLIAAGSIVTASAQRVYFAYFQTEDQSPFYVRITDKIYSSAASGYLILPNLSDSTYTIHLGFAKSTAPETRFTLTVNQNDKGYLIKNFSDGLVLFDMQNLTVVKSASIGQSTAATEMRSDRFSTVLSKAAHDPSLLQIAKREEKTNAIANVVTEDVKPTNTPATVEKEVVKPADTAITINKAASVEIVQDTIASATTLTAENAKPVVAQSEATTTVVVEETYKRSTIRRYAESSTTEGLGVTYFDQNENAIDTIRILIPPSKSKLIEDQAIKSVDTTTIQQPSLPSVAVDSVQTKPVVGSVSPAKEITNSSCNIASEKDFMKLRKNMAGKKTDEDMIAEAKKSFKSKCFTTEQLRYLGSLFLTSAARYQFFDAAYNHVADKQSFGSLQSEIKDEYYLKRFKALLGE